MTDYFKIASFSLMLVLLTSCSQILQTVDLNIDTEDNSSQEEFNIVEKTLTIREAKANRQARYSRSVLKSGRGKNAKPIPEKIAQQSDFPNNTNEKKYRIGVGDRIAFSRLIENNRTPFLKENKWPNKQSSSNYTLGVGDTLALTLIKQIDSNNLLTPSGGDSNQNLIITSQKNDETINSNGRIGSDGSVLLLEVGRLEASGKSLNELRSEVRNILIRNGVSPRFQLEIVDFKSQKSYLTVNSSSEAIILVDQTSTMRDVLTSASVGFKPGVTTRIRLQRDEKEYSILLRDLYNNNENNINIKPEDHIFVEDSAGNIKTTSSIVDHEGMVVFESIGKVKAAGRTLEELTIKVKKLIQVLPDSQNAFQIQITDFSSQKALLSIQGQPGVIIPITDKAITLVEALLKNGSSYNVDSITQVTLQRNDKAYVFTLDDLLGPKSPKLYIEPGDRITTEVLPYKENKVFILGAVSPQIFKINPANRETLADVLFATGGVLSSSSAKRSEVYLLRGINPVVAYHLDAQNPTRLIVADAMELRPNDILYVAEQPIASFNRTLATIVPLRILLRDIQNENIP